MSTYEYQCAKCQHVFSVTMSIAEHEKKKPVACPKCKSTDVGWHPVSFYAVTSKKS